MLRIFAFIALASLVLQPANGSAEATPVVSISFTAIAWDHPVTGIHYATFQRETPVSIPSFERSRTYRYTGSPHLVFYKTPDESLPPEPQVPVGEVSVLTGSKTLLLLFFPTAENRYNIIALPDDQQTHPEDKVRIFNASNYSLALKNGTQTPLIIAPGKQVLMDKTGRTLPLQVAYNKDGQWQIAMENVIALSPGKRLTLFLTVSDSPRFKLRGADGVLIENGPLQVFGIKD